MIPALPDTKAMELENNPLVMKAKELAIATKAQHEEALLIFDNLSKREKACTVFFKELKDPINSYKNLLMEKEHKILDPIVEAKQIVSRKAAAWTIEQERLAQEQAAAIAALAKKDEEDRRIADAEALEAAGQKEEAEELLSAPVEQPIVRVQANVATVRGVGMQGRWKAEVLDKRKLIAFVAKNPQWENLLEVNMPTLNKIAQAQREQMQNSIDGVRAVKESTLTSRGSKQT